MIPLKSHAPLGERVLDARTVRGLRQVDLATRSGISQGHLSQIERGDKIPTLATMKKLRDALGLTSLEWAAWVDAS